jgi:hypothetical protein
MSDSFCGFAYASLTFQMRCRLRRNLSSRMADSEGVLNGPYFRNQTHVRCYLRIPR